VRRFRNATSLIAPSLGRLFNDDRSRAAARGQVLVIFALSIFVVVGAMALSIDGGFVLAERRQVQSAADAAALAAARAKLSSATVESQISSGKRYGALNAGTSEDMVVIDLNPDGYGPNYVRATVTKDVQRFFVGAIYSGDWRVSASAVAGVEPDSEPYALLVLNKPLDLRGSVSLIINDGSVHVNDSVTRSGGSNIVDIDGTLSSTGSIASLDTWQVDGGIRPNTSFTVSDPLASTPPPAKGTPVTSAMLTAAGFTVSGPKWVCAGTCTLPGGGMSGGSYYYHDSNINPREIQAGGTVTFSPGIHYFDGTMKLTESNTSSHIVANGVMFYFTGSSRFEPGNGNFYISAPCLESTPAIATCSGEAAYPGGANGMALWIANCTPFDASGNGNYTIEGVIYAPCSFVSMDGTPGANGMQVIVGELQLRGTGSFTVNYRQYVEADYPKIWLVE
jgi:hypothetical protein